MESLNARIQSTRLRIREIIAGLMDSSALTWEQIKMNRGSAHGEEISNKLSIPLEHVNAVFDVFELEGKGFRSKTIGESYFSARSELISQK